MSIFFIPILAVLVAAARKRNLKAAESSELIRCESCFWEQCCSERQEGKLCEGENVDWEDAPWEKW